MYDLKQHKYHMLVIQFGCQKAISIRKM